MNSKLLVVAILAAVFASGVTYFVTRAEEPGRGKKEALVAAFGCTDTYCLAIDHEGDVYLLTSEPEWIGRIGGARKVSFPPENWKPTRLPSLAPQLSRPN